MHEAADHSEVVVEVGAGASVLPEVILRKTPRDLNVIASDGYGVRPLVSVCISSCSLSKA